jgi:crossover junction endodeoxyribonuclease RuvC
MDANILTLLTLLTLQPFNPSTINHQPSNIKHQPSTIPPFLLCNASRFGTMSCVGVTPQQFEQMRNRVSGSKRIAASIETEPVRPLAKAHQIVLGIDPSLRGTGYGVIRVAKPYPQTLAQGTINCPAGWPRSSCLVRIAQVMREVLSQHRPTACAVEGLFYAQNLQTALLMGEARGVCLLAAAEAGLDIYEIAARKVKQAMVGYGAAQKMAVAKMVQRLLRLSDPPVADAADALALALTYVQESRGYPLMPLKQI